MTTDTDSSSENILNPVLYLVIVVSLELVLFLVLTFFQLKLHLLTQPGFVQEQESVKLCILIL